MKTLHITTLASILFPILSSCANPTTPITPSQTNITQAATNTVTNLQIPPLSVSEKRKIGNKIWQNESAGKVSGLTAWNVGEEFPSLGIGHFIWYPKNFRGPYTESFPAFIKYAQRAGARDIPAWLLSTPVCPWNSRASFLADINKPQLASLRTFLANNIELQTDFIVYKSRAALQKMIAAAPASERAKIQSNYTKVSSTSNGVYALIDYVNFKGEGINPKERYKGQGWGLLQVLQNMQNVGSGQAATREFANSAKRMLDRRIANSDKARGESRWRAGWHNRCETYTKPL